MKERASRLVRRGKQRWGVAAPEPVPVSEREEAREAARRMLRERDESNVDEWDETEDE